MKIIKQGTLPPAQVFIGTCTNCGTKVQFFRDEPEVIIHRAEESNLLLSVPCPLTGCGRRIDNR